VLYCRRVAGSIGRLCLAIFGSAERERAVALADDLGVAMQLTNILRDVREDATHGRVSLPREDLLNGRIYLPRSELDSYGVRLGLTDDGSLDDPDGRLAALLRHAATRAQDWYCLGLRLVPHLDRRSAACCLAMVGIYRDLLGRISTDPTVVYRQRTSLTGWQKARVATTALARAVA
jgi:phytoene synthase